MKLLLPIELIRRLKKDVRRGRNREIGGVLVGEHVESETFRVVDFSVQRSGGTAAHFVRDPEHHREFLKEFFARTGNDYQRFNYIGEWHSHPGFAPLPSGEDITTMFDIVDNPDVGVNFAILMIVSARKWNRMELSATAFRKGGQAAERIEVGVEAPDAPESPIWRFLNFIRR